MKSKSAKFLLLISVSAIAVPAAGHAAWFGRSNSPPAPKVDPYENCESILISRYRAYKLSAAVEKAQYEALTGKKFDPKVYSGLIGTTTGGAIGCLLGVVGATSNLISPASGIGLCGAGLAAGSAGDSLAHQATKDAANQSQMAQQKDPQAESLAKTIVAATDLAEEANLTLALVYGTTAPGKSKSDLQQERDQYSEDLSDNDVPFSSWQTLSIIDPFKVVRDKYGTCQSGKAPSFNQVNLAVVYDASQLGSSLPRHVYESQLIAQAEKNAGRIGAIIDPNQGVVSPTDLTGGHGAH